MSISHYFSNIISYFKDFFNNFPQSFSKIRYQIFDSQQLKTNLNT